MTTSKRLIKFKVLDYSRGNTGVKEIAKSDLTKKEILKNRIR